MSQLDILTFHAAFVTYYRQGLIVHPGGRSSIGVTDPIQVIHGLLAKATLVRSLVLTLQKTISTGKRPLMRDSQSVIKKLDREDVIGCAEKS